MLRSSRVKNVTVGPRSADVPRMVLDRACVKGVRWGWALIPVALDYEEYEHFWPRANSSRWPKSLDPPMARNPKH